MRCAAGHQRRLAHEAGDRRVRALARRAAGAVGHRDELAAAAARAARIARPQRLLHLLRLRREELEGDVDLAGAEQPAVAFRAVGHQRVSSRACAVRAVRRRRRRGRLGQPQRDRELCPCRSCSGRELARARPARARILQPLRDLLGREAEPVVRVLLAQELELVRREIDDQQPCRPAPARALPRAMARCRLAQEVQHLMHDDRVGDCRRRSDSA